MTAGSPGPGNEDVKEGCPPEETDCEIQTLTDEQRERATELFNEKTRSGIQYLTDNGCLRPSPHNVEDIIDFLMNSQGMSKAHIGQFLGTRGELNEAVLHKLIGSLDCCNKNFVDCVRYLSYSPSLRLTPQTSCGLDLRCIVSGSSFWSSSHLARLIPCTGC